MSQVENFKLTAAAIAADFGTLLRHRNSTDNPHMTTAAQVGAAPADHSHTVATPTAPGFLSAADKAKLDNMAAGANAYTHPNHSGEVTSTGDGATVIAPNAVTVTKMQQVGANTMLGRASAGTGNVEVLAPAAARGVLGLGDAAVWGVELAVRTAHERDWCERHLGHRLRQRPVRDCR